MSQSEKFPFVTYDAALASALITKGYKVQSRRYLRSGKAYFTFQGAESLQRTIELYWNDGLLLNARTLLDEYKRIAKTTNDRLR